MTAERAIFLGCAVGIAAQCFKSFGFEPSIIVMLGWMILDIILWGHE